MVMSGHCRTCRRTVTMCSGAEVVPTPLMRLKSFPVAFPVRLDSGTTALVFSADRPRAMILDATRTLLAARMALADRGCCSADRPLAACYSPDKASATCPLSPSSPAQPTFSTPPSPTCVLRACASSPRACDASPRARRVVCPWWAVSAAMTARRRDSNGTIHVCLPSRGGCSREVHYSCRPRSPGGRAPLRVPLCGVGERYKVLQVHPSASI